MRRQEHYDSPSASERRGTEPLASPERHQRTVKLLGVAFILLGVLWLSSLLRIPGSLLGSERTLIDQTLPGNSLQLTAVHGDVEIQPWDRSDFRVQVFQRGPDNPQAVAVRRDGTTVQVFTQQDTCVMICLQELRYVVQVPAGSPADITTVSGDTTVEGAGALQIHTASGDVQLRDIHGPISVETISGDVQLNDGQGDQLQMSSVSGDIDLNQVSGALRVRSTSGDIVIEGGERNQLTLDTTSGDIEYQGSLSTTDSRIVTISGDVQLRLPATSDLTLALSTVSGELDNGLTLRDQQQRDGTLQGIVGNGQAHLSIETTSGDITLEGE